MRTPFVAGNWKMNGSAASAQALVAGICGESAGGLSAEVDIAVCPPFVYLAQVAAALTDQGVGLGAQNVSEFDSGAYTGEVAPSMLVDLGCRYAIVGHSERRHIYGESNTQVAEKFVAAGKAGMSPIVCVGEQLEDRESDNTEAVVGAQLDAVMDLAGANALAASVVAYEPVWAIGTGRTASPEQAEAVHAFIRGRVAAADASVAAGLRIVYGGSVKPDNASGLFGMENIDGGLIGGAALDAGDFLAICAAARR